MDPVGFKPGLDALNSFGKESKVLGRNRLASIVAEDNDL
jgi:hypothetical protein